MANELVFRLVQLEGEDLENLLSLIEQEHTQNPEKWGNVFEALDVGRATEILWATWDVTDEDLPDSSIPLIKWNNNVKWQIGLPVPSSFVQVVTRK